MNKPACQLDMWSQLPTPGERYRSTNPELFPDAVVVDVETRYPVRASNVHGRTTFITFAVMNDRIRSTWTLEDFSRRYKVKVSV